jgi:Tc toxin complex TcA C-terminal TcB-binding domain/ABC toxin N-terminal region/Neuraminidase-like domain/Carboxypeptidase regulatory-like domain/Putative peptidoglycan binding domain/Salmonella virulence plasmid 28.1kDa A protein
MDLQGRNLRLDMQGPDVELLLQELRSLRFDIPASETAFGRATLEAVMFLQGWERLGPTGIVDEPTAAAINRLFHQIGAGGTLSGIVVSQFGDPLAGALVEALGLGLSGRTDDDGRYEIGPISTGLVQLRASAAEYAAEQAEALVEGGQSAARDFTLKRVETLMVRGRVRHQDGRRLVNAVVRAFDRDLRREELLGETKPDATGHYEIRYARDGFARAEKENADLVVRAFAPDGRELAVSPVLFNAPATADVDLTVAAGVWDLPSLFETLGLAVSPLMGDVALEELDEDAEHRDLSFLAGETGFAWELLARFVVSYRMPGEGLEPEFWFAVLGGGALRISEARGLSDQLPSLAQMAAGLDIGAVQKSLTGAFNLKEIAERLRERVPAWMEAFKRFVGSRAISDSPDPSFVKAALEHAGIDGGEKQEQFALLFADYRAFTPEMARRLKETRLFTGGEIAELQTSFSLADMTRGDFSTVRVIKETFEVRKPEQIRALAGRSEADWVDLVKTRHDAGEITLPLPTGEVASRVRFPVAETYGKILSRRFREAFPTAAFAGDMGRAMRNGGVKGLDHAPAISRLLDEHPRFDLLTTTIDEFLDGPDGENLGDADTPAFRLELKAVQRLFKLAPGFEATATLLADGVHSAQQIYAMGQGEFVQHYASRAGFTGEEARMAWNRAADTYAAVLTILGDLKAFDTGMPAAVGSSAGARALASFPNWNNLFKTGDLCECEACRSVLGPAAYLADLLEFLRHRGATTTTARDVLFRRRPDLGWLELNCPNGSVPLPYIDLVNEVLEAVIAAGENDQELVGFTVMPANPVQAKKAVLIALSKVGLDAGADFSISQVRPDPDHWVVHGEAATYRLKKKATPNFFAEVLPNTKASADELRAYPQYVNPKAYLKLRQSTYPLALPFDLFAEEVRASFQKTNLPRWDLMRALRGIEPPNKLTDGDIAAEYFGISIDPSATVDEKRLILVADPSVTGQQILWGQTGGGWLNVIGNVSTFLRKTGLEYNEMLALLDLNFINPKGDITVEYTQPSCDVAQQWLRVLDAPKLDRIHRFLRLWRKLAGWQMWELDLALSDPVIGHGLLDESFLVHLFQLSEARWRLGPTTSIEQALALFGDLNTRTRFAKPFEKRADALYQNLFLNRRLIQPLDAAFHVSAVAVAPPTAEKISGHRPTMVAALGIREPDLATFQALTKASDGLPYIGDDLTLANLSFLWRHAWLAKALKWTAEEWRVLLRLLDRDLDRFPSAAALLQFLDTIDALKATGVPLDELSWLLGADRSAKTATKETDAATFLRALRRQLQAIRAGHDPAQYDFLTVTPPTNVEQLDALLTGLLAELKRGDAEARGFLATLRGRVILESAVAGLPAAFAFPTAVTGGTANIPITHDTTSKVLRFTGVMTDSQRNSLLDDTGLALAALRATSKPESPAQLQTGFAFDAGITGPPNNIPIQYDQPNARVRFSGLMTEAQRTVLLTDPLLTAVTGEPAYVGAIQDLFQQSVALLTVYRGAIEDLYQQSVAASEVYLSTRVKGPSSGSLTLPAAFPSIPISYDATSHTFSFTGLMSTAEQTALKGVATNPATVIDELFLRPRLAAKFFEPVFTAPLESLPPAIDFPTLLPQELAARVAYDEEERVLRVTGILSKDEAALLKGLATDNSAIAVAYRTAVDSLSSQPTSIAAPDRRVWLTEPDLDQNQPASDTLAKRLANAARKALQYLADTRAANAVVDAASAQLGLTPAVTRFLATRYALLPATLLDHLTGTFAATTGVVDRATLTNTFDAWFWANRVASIWRRGKLTLTELRRIDSLTAAGKLLDFGTLPLDDTAGVASLDEFLRLARLLRLRDTLPEPELGLLDLLRKLKDNEYTAEADVTGLPAGFTFPAAITGAPNSIPIQYDETNQKLRLTGVMRVDQLSTLLNDATLAAVTGIASYQQAVQELYRSVIEAFAADVELVVDDWTAADVSALILHLDLRWSEDYLLPETWERLIQAFSFAGNLNAGASTLVRFAATTMGPAEAKTIKELLRSKFGAETWLTLCAEIQDALRERKRDALAAYLLTQPQPADAPTAKWENTNDLYAYYLLDVEMSACQLTSRLVQASGSVQLFVQRCFMGLEPSVPVNEDAISGDSAWRWWSWMRKYRVWEANRKIFLWPENWIEPELRVDRSSFFRDLENELVQNEIGQASAETALAHYLEKLDGVAHLEVAGFYQEDDGENTIVHVFARTPGGEPHLYYYRRFDYHQWTPWERVDLEIQGDYLIPAVINRRLFLFWPVFKEVPDESSNSSVTLPAALGSNTSRFTPDKTSKILQMQMASSEYRGGQWTPKQVSKSFAESASYDVEIVSRYYTFFAIDRSETEGRFFIMYEGNSHGKTPGIVRARLKGEAEMSGCSAPDLAFTPKTLYQSSGLPTTKPDPMSTGTDPVDLRWLELNPRQDAPDNDLTLQNTSILAGAYNNVPVLQNTPGLFQLSPGWHQSYLNRLAEKTGTWYPYSPVITGTWLPFFYRDSEHSFFVLPSTPPSGVVNQPLGSYYPVIKAVLRSDEAYFGSQIDGWLEGFILMLTPTERADLGNWLFIQLNLPLVPSTDDELKAAIRKDPQQAVYFYLVGIADQYIDTPLYHFQTFYHPLICEFGKLLNNPLKGVPALMSRNTQLQQTTFRFYDSYHPTASVVLPTGNVQNPHSEFYPREDVDFSPAGAYSAYNWELFFHVPLFIANTLSRNQSFEEARDWYHFIFNPLGVATTTPGGSPMSKYWITKPFFQTKDAQYLQQRIDSLLRLLAGDPTAPGYPQMIGDIQQAVLDWRTHPFEPHRIASYRTVAYQKTVVMKYVENLVAWGDQLFRQDTMESINEAAQLYVMAAEILGPKPKTVPPQAMPVEQTYNELEFEIDDFANSRVQVENLIPRLPGNGNSGANQPPLPMLYFCIPTNEQMLAQWDTVADRLYKIRHCMNIEGVERQLALFEPPINPAALVKAVAGGMDISAALSDLDAPLPLYRFTILLQKANEVCSDVRSLGAALLAALEKKDAEALGLLRQTQEIRLLDAVKALREQQIEEAKENLEGLKRSKVVVETRRDHYRDIERLNAQESLQLSKMAEAHLTAEIAQGITLGASIISYLPAIDLGASGFGGSPIAKFKIGGLELGQAASLASEVLNFISQIASNDAAMASSKGSFDRRWDDWKLQESLAEKELDQLDRQIAAAEIRVALAEKELDNHVVQMESAKATDAFMRSKYTSQDLYQWQTGQISSVYMQSYKLAYDLAKRAERGFRFELGLADSSYINFGYWDSLKKGLLAGERLQYDLRRLETAYLEQNRREFELTKHVSLAMLDPLALVRLRETGRCFFRLPEELFDLDYPGHYFRRIKSVSVSLPSVVGPYTTVSCTLRLLNNSIRVNTAKGDGYPRNADSNGLPADDSRFVENNIPFRAMVASSGQDDSGVFELNFHDDRYLPFEGAGAISQWALELFSDPAAPDFGRPLRQFDYGTITDVIMHIKYTAREDAGVFKNDAIAHLRESLEENGTVPSLRLFDLRHEFPSQWHRFLNPADETKGNVFELEMKPELFPWRDVGKTLKIETIFLLARCTDSGSYSVWMSPPLPPAAAPPDPNKVALARVSQYGGLHLGRKDVSALGVEVSPTDAPTTWKIKVARPDGGNLQNDTVTGTMELEDLMVVVQYAWAS